MGAIIRTFTGRQLDLLHPDLADIAIEDIAHGLARTCRFSGQCARFYSVAEHAFQVSYMVPPPLALWGLLHDASEAYLSDLVSPLKRTPALLGYREIEDRLMVAILERFGLIQPGACAADPPAVGAADRELLVLEQAVLFDGLDLTELACLEPPGAEALFLTRYREIGAGGATGSAGAVERAARRLLLEGRLPVCDLDAQTLNLLSALRLGLAQAGDHGCGA